MAEPALQYRNGFIVLDGIRLAKFCPKTGCLEFFDKDLTRSQERGSRLVYKDPIMFTKELLAIIGMLQLDPVDRQ